MLYRLIQIGLDGMTLLIYDLCVLLMIPQISWFNRLRLRSARTVGCGQFELSELVFIVIFTLGVQSSTIPLVTLCKRSKSAKMKTNKIKK